MKYISPHSIMYRIILLLFDILGIIKLAKNNNVFEKIHWIMRQINEIVITR